MLEVTKQCSAKVSIITVVYNNVEHIRKVGSKVADETGEQIAANIGGVIKQTFNGWCGSDLLGGEDAG